MDAIQITWAVILTISFLIVPGVCLYETIFS